MNYLTKSEEILLLAIWRLKEDAYGVKIRKQVMEVTQQNYTYGTLYSALDQMVRKGYASKSIGEPTKERGGRRKIYYQITPTGVEALKQTRKLEITIWDGISDLALEQGLI